VRNQNLIMVEGSVSGKQVEAMKTFKETFASIMEGIDPKTAVTEIEVKKKPGEDYVQVNEVQNISTGDVTSIEHKPRQVILVDIWATWCPPCQKPMGHNQHMLETRGEEWGDRVRIIGVSIDNTVEAVKKHVKEKGWEKVEHFHRGASTISQDYGA